jgi:hypothetical protein
MQILVILAALILLIVLYLTLGVVGVISLAVGIGVFIIVLGILFGLLPNPEGHERSTRTHTAEEQAEPRVDQLGDRRGEA